MSDTSHHAAAGRTRHALLLAAYVTALLGLAVFYYVLRLDLLSLPPRLVPLLRRIVVGAMAIMLTLALARVVRASAVDTIDNPVTRYNLQRIVGLVVFMLVALIVVSVLFANWYAAAASLGLISLVLGFALQTPITSFIGWIYILARQPYRVGDRISIGDATGDVIEVTYLDTTLWEVGGPFVSSSHPSGRLIKFPNANVLTSTIYNFSWEMFPYIWDEISFQVAYDSDLSFVSQVMQHAAGQELGEAMIDRVRTFRQILARTPVDEVEVKEDPAVLFRVNANTWIDAKVRYVVDPKRAGSVKTRLMRVMLEQLSAQPERVRFPRGDSR